MRLGGAGQASCVLVDDRSHAADLRMPRAEGTHRKNLALFKPGGIEGLATDGDLVFAADLYKIHDS